jgi:hypothetical protein
MAQKDNILQELRELQSSLAKSATGLVYQVPAGYFEDLAGQVLRRIKALESTDVREELNHLSPLLNSLSRQMPYNVPTGYFDQLEETIAIIGTEDETPVAELEMLSPLLSGLKKEMPYSVPAGYFQQIGKATTTEGTQETRVVSITKRSWFRYAVAAVITGVIVMSGFLVFNNKNKINPEENSYAWVEKSLKKVSTDDIDEFTELAVDGTVASADIRSEVNEINEIRELVKDIPEKDIQQFIEETESAEPDVSNDELFMN